jgi:hypothetical protein
MNLNGVPPVNGMLVYHTGSTLEGAGVYVWMTDKWVKASSAGSVASSAYTGSTSIVMDGKSFKRSELTGDVIAGENSNETKIASNAVTETKIASNAVTETKIASNAVTSAKIANGGVTADNLATGAVTAAKLAQMSATDGQVLKWNDTGNVWAPADDADTNTTYTGSTSITLSGTSFQLAELTGDVTAAANSNATIIGDGKVTSAKILDKTITAADIADKAVGSGQLADGAVTVDKITKGAAGQILTTNSGGTAVAWAAPDDADNGLTKSGTTVQLGGTLTKDTEINTVTNNLYTTGTGKVSIGKAPGTSSAKFEVDGAAANTTAYAAADSYTIDFSKSNLAYTTKSAGAFTLTNLKDGGTYTLAVQGTTSSTSTFTAKNTASVDLLVKILNNKATTSGKQTLYTIIVMGTTAYVFVNTGF